MQVDYRGYQIKPQKEIPSSYVIVTSGRGGKVPNVMTGLFTSVTWCKNVIDTYLARNSEGTGTNETSK